MCHSIIKGVQVNSFDYLGDGNVHYNCPPLVGYNDLAGLDETLAFYMWYLPNKMGGGFAAQNAMGHAKASLANKVHDQLERELLMQMKNTFDKNGTLNTGVIVT